MRPIRTTLALLSAVTLAFTMTLAPVSAVPPEGTLITAPAVQEWQPAGGPDFKWHGREIVFEGGDPELAKVAATLAEDIGDQTGRTPKVVQGKPKPGSIALRLGDQGKGPESYSLDIDKALTITGTTAHGVFNGTRTVLQLLHQDDRIPMGTVVDWPTKEVRSILVDNTPRHFSMGWWENLFKHMSYFKLNDTNLYLDGVGLDKDEMRAIDALGQKYFVKVVPQINMPSHMHVLLPSRPEYQLRNADGSLNPTALDLTNPEAVDWALSLITDHVDLFSGDEWHLGSDEFPGWPGTGENHPQLDAYAKERFGPEATFADLFADFQNRANELVKSHGKTMRVWNDMIRTSAVVQLDEDVTVEYWIQHPDLPGLLSGADIAERGNPLINAHIDHLYYDQSRRNLDPRHVYENFDVDVIHWETPVPSDAVRGARLPVWLAWIYTSMESDAEVLDNIVPSMAALAQSTWGSPKLAETWTGFRSEVLSVIGEAPGLNAESHNSILPDPAAATNADGTVVYFARDAEGNLWTGKQSRPTVTHFSQQLLSEGISGDPAVTTLADGRLQVAARTASDRLFVATQRVVNSETFDGATIPVRVDADPALVPGTAVVNNNGRLEAVDLATGKVGRITQNAVGEPAAAQVDGVLHAVSRTKHGVAYAVASDAGWSVLSDPRKLASEPDLVATGDGAILIGIDAAGALVSGSAAGSTLTWTEVLPDADGQQTSAVGEDGVVHVVTLTGADTLVHAWSADGAWESGEVGHHMAEDDPSLGLNHLNEPFIFAKFDNGMQVVATPTGPAQYAWNVLAESTTGPAAVTFDSLDRPVYFVATTYGDLQTGTKWGNLWEWGRDFAIGDMSYPDDELSPQRFDNVLLSDDFAADSSARYTTLDTSDWEVAPQPVIGDGVLEVSADEAFYSTVVSDVPVAPGDTVLITSVDKWLEGSRRQDTLMVGFVRDARNYSVMWVGHGDNRIGFDTVSDGRLTPNGGNGNVPVVVEKGDRIAVVLSGNWMTGYVERNGVWHRVHTAVAMGDDDLRDPAVRAQYRYAVGLRGDKGTLQVGELIAAERG